MCLQAIRPDGMTTYRAEPATLNADNVTDGGHHA
jgi:hypothetical protein